VFGTLLLCGDAVVFAAVLDSVYVQVGDDHAKYNSKQCKTLSKTSNGGDISYLLHTPSCLSVYIVQ
jgi:hypothetical protein